MKPLKDLFYLKANIAKSSESKILGLDGKPLFIDTDFNPFEHAIQCCEVMIVPGSISKRKTTYDDAARG